MKLSFSAYYLRDFIKNNMNIEDFRKFSDEYKKLKSDFVGRDIEQVFVKAWAVQHTIDMYLPTQFDWPILHIDSLLMDEIVQSDTFVEITPDEFVCLNNWIKTDWKDAMKHLHEAREGIKKSIEKYKEHNSRPKSFWERMNDRW